MKEGIHVLRGGDRVSHHTTGVTSGFANHPQNNDDDEAAMMTHNEDRKTSACSDNGLHLHENVGAGASYNNLVEGSVNSETTGKFGKGSPSLSIVSNAAIPPRKDN